MSLDFGVECCVASGICVLIKRHKDDAGMTKERKLSAKEVLADEGQHSDLHRCTEQAYTHRMSWDIKRRGCLAASDTNFSLDRWIF